MQNRILLLIICLSMSIESYTQVSGSNGYIIMTFERTVNKYPQHGIEKFFWIMPVDSIYDKHFSIFPLFIDGFSRNNLDSCCEAQKIDPFTITTQTNYDFDSNYLSEINHLQIIIKSQRKKVQEIIKKWAEDYKEVIKVYATPITGKFCSCILKKDGKKKVEYDGIVFIPMSSFSIYKNFVESKKYRFMIFSDYSKINFDIKPW